MEDLVGDWPVWLVFAVLWAAAFARGTATYWVGRGVRAGGSRSRWSRHLDSAVVQRAEGWVRRFGAPAVTLGFLTVGVQTAINASAGMLRMPQRRFLPAVTLGAALWSLVYTTVGFTVLDAWFGDLSRWWALVAVGVVVAIVLVSRRLERPATSDAGADAGTAATVTAEDPAAPAGRRGAAMVTSWALASTCWHAPIMEARPSGVPEALTAHSVTGPPARAPASSRPADDRPQRRR